MASEKPSTLELQRWYRKRVRPFLAAEEAGRIDSPHNVDNIAGIQGPQLDTDLLDNLA